MNSAISLPTSNASLPAFLKIAELRPNTLIKRGEAIQFNTERVYESEHVIPGIFSKVSDDSEMLIQFKKFAEELRQIAPKAKDFLYFSAIMMHAAEAALLNDDGSLKKDASGQELTATWEKRGESWKWNCSDSNVRPYKNSNNDIFPEEELIKAHKKWVGRPLCLDHKSSSVDMIRGVIVDTYYDRNKKRVVALCALDKINYPDLARKVSTGVAASVSMGTAVGKAICTENGCHRVARVEADFCDHMRKKSGYGEINIDLSPIELSIVVNGADPQAKIRYIVAAADSIARYVNMKQDELHKLAEDETRDIELSKEVVEGLEQARAMLLQLQTKVEQLQGNEEAEQERHEQQTGTETSVAEASQDLTIKQVVPMINSIMKSLGQLDEKFNKLVTTKETQMTQKNAYFQGPGGVNEPTPGKPKYEKEEADSIRNNQDKHMESPQDTGPVDGLFPGDEQKKKELLRAAEVQQRELKRQAALKRVNEVLQKGAYYQGAGGANEPTPGKAKYPKEEADKIRNTEDKHQVGAPPFPGVGKLDGLYDKDLETKKKLLRAKLTAKFIKAAKSDGTLDLGESRWQVYADDKLVMTATVNEITGKKAESLYSSVATREFGRDLIAKIKTEGFEKAASLYKGAQALGGAAPAPAAPLPGGAGSPMVEPMGEDPLAMPGEDAGLDQGKSGDPKEMIADISHQLSNLSADLAQANDALNEAPANELQDFDQLAGAGAESALPAAAASETATLINMQKKLSQALVQGIKQTCVDIKDHQEELKLATMLVSDASIMKEASSEKKQTINTMVKDACDDAKRTLADGVKLMGAFVKYARGTQSLVKRANKEIALMKKTAQFAPSGQPGDPLDPTLPGQPSGAAYTAPKTMGPNLGPAKPGDPKAILPKTKAPVQPTKPQDTATHIKDWPENYGDRSGLESMLMNNTRESPLGGQFQAPRGQGPSGQMADDGNAADTEVAFNEEMQRFLDKHYKDDTAKAAAKKALEEHKKTEKKDDNKDVGDLKVSPDGGMEGTPEEVGKAMKEKEASNFNLKTKEGRAAYRTKLAEKGLTFSDMLTKAHGKGGFTTQLDVKPTGDLAKVETLEETHKAMMDVANAPPKVRKQAEEIQKYVAAGQINPATDFEGLIAQGLDADAVKYWKAYWGQSKDGGSDFGSKLVQDYSNKKVAEEKESYKVKVLRAFSLANEMAEKEMIGKDASSINTQVNEMLAWNDESFESLKKIVSRSVVKKASALPQVGMLGVPDMIFPAPEAEQTDLRSKLDACFANSWKPRW